MQEGFERLDKIDKKIKFYKAMSIISLALSCKEVAFILLELIKDGENYFSLRFDYYDAAIHILFADFWNRREKTAVEEKKRLESHDNFKSYERTRHM